MRSGSGLALNAGTSRGAAGWLHPPECWGYSFGTGTSTGCVCDSPPEKGPPSWCQWPAPVWLGLGG